MGLLSNVTQNLKHVTETCNSLKSLIHKGFYAQMLHLLHVTRT